MNAFERRVSARLAALRAGHLLRTLSPPAGIDLTSNDYLGLSRHSQIRQRMIEAIRREGCGSTGSRLLRGHREAFSRIERLFAGFKRAERALYFSSGYLANLAVLTTFPEPGDVIFSDERNHASLVDGIRLSATERVIAAHNDVDAFDRLLAKRRTGHAFVVVESLYSMDGDAAPLHDLVVLCQAAGATLIVDEAHAVGVYGARGSGLVEAADADRDVFVTINPAGKALGVSGAFVCGPEWAIEYLLQRARPFIFSTAPPPAVADAIEASLEIVTAEPDRRATLLRRARYFRDRLAAAGVAVLPGDSQIIPVVIGANDRALAVAGAMQRAGFDVRAIRPPSVAEGSARLRLTVNIGLDETMLDRAVASLAAALNESSRCSAAFS